MNFYYLLPDMSKGTGHWIIDDPSKPAHQETVNTVRILIIKKAIAGTGFLMYSYTKEGSLGGDTWHQSLDEAKQYAKSSYKANQNDWIEIPQNVENPLSYVLEQLK